MITNMTKINGNDDDDDDDDDDNRNKKTVIKLWKKNVSKKYNGRYKKKCQRISTFFLTKHSSLFLYHILCINI